MFLISPRIIVNETSEEGKDHCASSSRIRGRLVLNIKHRFTIRDNFLSPSSLYANLTKGGVYPFCNFVSDKLAGRAQHRSAGVVRTQAEKPRVGI